MPEERYRAPEAQLPTDADREVLARVRRTRVDREAYEKYGVQSPDAQERAEVREILRSRREPGED